MTPWTRYVGLSASVASIVVGSAALSREPIQVSLPVTLVVVPLAALLIFIAPLRKLGPVAATSLLVLTFLAVRVAVAAVSPERARLPSLVAQALLVSGVAGLAWVSWSRFGYGDRGRRARDQMFRVPSVDDAERAIEVELARTRRFERPLAVAVLEVAAVDGHPHIGPTGTGRSRSLRARRVLLADLASATSEELRRTDMLMRDASGRMLVLISPETDLDGMSTLIERAFRRFYQQTEVTTAAGVAHFPADGLTFDALLTRAKAALRAPAATDLGRRSQSLLSDSA